MTGRRFKLERVFKDACFKDENIVVVVVVAAAGQEVCGGGAVRLLLCALSAFISSAKNHRSFA
jgi:hypothetical protein